jgi:hypothetical protein
MMASVSLYLLVWRLIVRSLGRSRKLEAGISLLRQDAQTTLGTSARRGL